jgi:hypothetical protein
VKEVQMALGKEQLVMVFDTESGKARMNDGPWVFFKGCIAAERLDEIIREQKKRDDENPPPTPPDNRDGYWTCKKAAGATLKTWHWCTTVPPYTCTDSKNSSGCN